MSRFVLQDYNEWAKFEQGALSLRLAIGLTQAKPCLCLNRGINRMKTLSLATAISILAFSAAYADCPNGATYSGGVTGAPSATFGFNAFGLSGHVPQAVFDSGSQTSGDCHTAGALGIGTGTAVSGVIVADPGDETKGIYEKPITVAYGQNSTAIGNGAMVGKVETYTDNHGTPDDTSDDTEEKRLVPVNNGTAVGANAKVTHNNSTAIGAGAESTREHQITLGTGQDTIKARGITSEKSRARQSGPLELVTTDAFGNLASDAGQTFSQINANTALLSQHSAQLETQGKGIAIAMAMPDAWLGDKERFSIAGSVGGFDGETAIAFAAIVRIDQTWSLNAGLGADTSFEEFGWKVGARAGW